MAQEKVNKLLEQLAQQGEQIRAMLRHPAGHIIEERLKAELDWVKKEWGALLESRLSDRHVEKKRHELYAYLRALQLCEWLFVGLPQAGWRAQDKLLAFAKRLSSYTSEGTGEK